MESNLGCMLQIRFLKLLTFARKVLNHHGGGADRAALKGTLFRTFSLRIPRGLPIDV